MDQNKTSALNTGVLLVNLGSPDSATEKDVKKYLTEFLMDPHVIQNNFILRWILVNLIIVPNRTKESTEAYQQVWTDQGSPLVLSTKKLKDEVKEKLPFPIEIAMRYQNPSIEVGIKNLLKKNPNIKTIILTPLYPQFAESSTQTVITQAKKVLKKINKQINLKSILHFYNYPLYIDALVKSAEPFLKSDFDHLLFSYHGLPENHLTKIDPTKNHCLQTKECCVIPSKAWNTCYRHQCFTTTQLFIQKAKLPTNKFSISFQSRLGKDPWIQPFTDIVLSELPKKGIKKLGVICPSFVSDCLETIEEIGMRGKEIFINSGGEKFEYIPCLNTNESWVNALSKLILSHNRDALNKASNI